MERIIHKKEQAKGVWAKVDGVSVFVSAKRVVVSCGSIGTPALLLRSGLKNTQIGKNLHLHPVTTISGVFPDRQIKPFHGSIMTTVSNVVADRSGSGYGARLEVPAIHPSMLATLLPWDSAFQHRKLMATFNNTATFIVLCRDYDSIGRVYIDKNGDHRVDYKLSQYDSTSILNGLEAGIRVLIAAGAKSMFLIICILII